MNDQIKEAAETPVAKLRNALTPIYSFASSYLLLKENPFNDSEILIQQANRIDSNRHVIDDLLTQLESEYALSDKEEIKAYKKQISELQSKLMTERRSNAKIAKRAEKAEEWISVETRLPDNGQAVLVWQNNLSDKECSRLQKATFLSVGTFKLYPAVHSTIFKKDNGYKNYDLEGDMCEITHWMPLPSPPKSK